MAANPSSKRSSDDLLPDLATAYASLQALLISTVEIDEFLSELAMLAVDVIGPVDSCGITLRRDGQAMTVTSSDPLAAFIDELQYGRGVGPCLQALHTGHIVMVSNLVDERRWGDYPLHALEAGVAASLSLPLFAVGTTVGAMNLYSGLPHEFTKDEIAQASSFAAQASGALGLVQRQATQLQLTTQLMDALESRTVIDQAMGVLMGQRRISAAAAFDALRAESQHRNVKLHIIASELIDTTTGHAAEPGRAFNQRTRRRP
jgi:GAF domain-containing protein